MKTKDITFSPEAIASIRAGTKTTTRRRIKNPPRWWEGHFIGYKVYPNRRGLDVGIGHYAELICERDADRQRRNVYGEPGDRLRVRGTDLVLRIQRVELAGGSSSAVRLAKRAWKIEFALMRKRSKR
jgi:hypothetical protein